MNKIDIFNQSQKRQNLPDIRPGDTVRVSQKIKEGEKQRVQAFEGLVIAKKHGKEIGATITVRRTTSGFGVERVFPIHSSVLEKIEILKRGKARRAKLYYLRRTSGKKGRLKEKGNKNKVKDIQVEIEKE